MGTFVNPADTGAEVRLLLMIPRRLLPTVLNRRCNMPMVYTMTHRRF